MQAEAATSKAEQAIRIRKIPIKELGRFAERYFSGGTAGRVVPLSRLRAAAHAANCWADDDDIGLVVAMCGDECIGYLGLMPGMLKVNGDLFKIHWYTTWFVGPAARQTARG